MGCCSSQPRQTAVDPGLNSAAFPQLLFLGLDSAGKTTLMYRTLIPDWQNIESCMEPTKAFHYEVFHRGKLRIGMWDLSGDPALRRSWSAFYRYVQVWAVVLVVSLVDLSGDRVAENRSLLNVLLNEACLKSACVFVVFNTMGHDAEAAPVTSAELAGRLGLFQAAAAEGSRVRWFAVNCREGERDSQWAEALRIILEKFNRILCPRPPPPTRAGGAAG
ncbi:hypothetical protein Esti_003948 [Eimeria stiedai]